HLTGGAVSGMTACVMLQPLDLIKTRLQQSRHDSMRAGLSPHKNTVILTVRDILKNNGVSGLWRGTLPTIVRNVPGTAMYFAALSEIRHVLDVARPTIQRYSPFKPSHKDKDKWENLICGAAARGTVGYILMPVTVLKVRYESNLYNYESISGAFRHILKNDGIRGLFAGFGATFIRDAPFAGIYLFFYEHFKALANGWKADHDVAVANMAINLGAGITAGTAATCITQPFDMIKTRMQLDRKLYRTTWSTSRKVFMENGFRGFFDGISLRLARKPLSSAISWAVYEEIV
ncbi:mitochondrial carrier domain-containing protein, partial [Dichotomocladium elegans]